MINREKIFARDNWTCRYCGRYFPLTTKIFRHQVVLELDHIIPVSKGGSSKSENLCACCSDCSELKKDKQDFSDQTAKLNVKMLERWEYEIITPAGHCVLIRPKGARGLGGLL